MTPSPIIFERTLLLTKTFSFHVTMRILLLVFVALLVGCDHVTHVVEPDTRAAFVLDPTKPFVIELGRGSGLNGLDIVKVDETGTVLFTRFEGRPKPETASLQLSNAELASLVSLVNTNQITSMGRTYTDPAIADGTQWVLWIEQPQSQKSIYFNNAFPSPIVEFSEGLNTLLHDAGAPDVTWQVLPEDEALKQQHELWARIE